MPEIDVRIEAGWKKALAAEFELPYFRQIREFLIKARQDGKWQSSFMAGQVPGLPHRPC